MSVFRSMKIKKQVQETNEVSSIYDANITIEEGGTGLLIVDPQNDFHPGGSLAIETADEDAARIAALIKSNLLSLSHIYVTLDSHQKYHIAHPLFWVNARNEHPEPFTTITKKMVETGEWKTKRKEHQAWGLRYVTQLAEKGNFELTIWPEHCLIGTSGHNVRQVIQDALHEWEEVQGKAVTYVIKGNNSKSEHYSAIKAEVIVPGDEWNTSLNNVLLNELKDKKMVETGEWKTKRKEHQAWGLRYVTQLAEKGNFELTIWPEHCLIGTSGHNVRQVIQDALHEWEEVQGKAVTYVMKGNNSKSEHYSAIKAEVIVPGDEWNTSLNNVLLNELKRHMRLLICGQASS
eukprot:CAMPEP_0204843408 /NCGR_PEP_ID=MMETSP1346-20131115/47957_1 /ASSEMBLY_ACC=CAM_ASM_000771 /TAXON_ID=215587 /ORGANISM="Aplanochytrium stocchinoi, Strain GSBS06" /LENGTH=346 /DNA_ID=CAMNT_0051982545 /DNA_START=430 /DNA_END=1471 /DNA_ORIENTATION=+